MRGFGKAACKFLFPGEDRPDDPSKIIFTRNSTKNGLIKTIKTPKYSSQWALYNSEITAILQGFTVYFKGEKVAEVRKFWWGRVFADLRGNGAISHTFAHQYIY